MFCLQVKTVGPNVKKKCKWAQVTGEVANNEMLQVFLAWISLSQAFHTCYLPPSDTDGAGCRETLDKDLQSTAAAEKVMNNDYDESNIKQLN